MWVIGSATVQIVACGFFLAQRLCKVVGGCLICTAVKVVTHYAVLLLLFLVLFFVLVATVHSLLGVVKYSIEFALQLTYNLGTLQFSLIYSFLPVGFLQSSAPYVKCGL